MTRWVNLELGVGQVKLQDLPFMISSWGRLIAIPSVQRRKWTRKQGFQQPSMVRQQYIEWMLLTILTQMPSVCRKLLFISISILNSLLNSPIVSIIFSFSTCFRKNEHMESYCHCNIDHSFFFLSHWLGSPKWSHVITGFLTLFQLKYEDLSLFYCQICTEK
jgi:hypothetical protein